MFRIRRRLPVFWALIQACMLLLKIIFSAVQIHVVEFLTTGISTGQKNLGISSRQETKLDRPGHRRAPSDAILEEITNGRRTVNSLRLRRPYWGTSPQEAYQHARRYQQQAGLGVQANPETKGTVAQLRTVALTYSSLQLLREKYFR
ncbi:hypothetical protein VOLCADRAFT_91614 [Volvox carteri f. nagariensis]|uniref:Uncharacterized protein n=1 Tax=Volvox carteri f. nagariensis TaxID=3068 RepID=D8TXJ4_VOLCA|nr:uncharacterized protein VOLCADRAFT_91614 [Volvox carteri f. nagariensis]EFJ47733.1 hypothetical protein VOLCADRAFT_91614 [Volvox carteri f. nagariensis]|eukprot:XP_002951204.1 hypothetical protein VOLCADRAFT_91614 [Volvox carteri f. nagariensis]